MNKTLFKKILERRSMKDPKVNNFIEIKWLKIEINKNLDEIIRLLIKSF